MTKPNFFDSNYQNKEIKRILLIDANDQRRWVGSRVEPEIHIPPLGLLYIASYALKHNPKLEIKIIETSLDASSEEIYYACLDDFRPDMVGIRSICMFFDEFKRITELTKTWGDVPVIGGGPIAATKRDILLKEMDCLDLVAVGEGERTFSRLLEGEPLGSIEGLLYRSKEGIVNTGLPKIVENLDDLPFPDFTLVKHDRYKEKLSYTYNYRTQGVLLTSRGCPYQCTYCNTFAGKTVRLRSAENVFEEMDRLWKSYGIEDFYFVDDVFNINKERTRKIFQTISHERRNWKLYLVNGIRADLMTHELVDLMVDAGTVWVTYGIETASPRIQKLIKKQLDLKKAADIINYTQDKGIVVNIDTMYGFPSETPEEAQLTLNYLGQLNIPSLLPYHFRLRLFEGCEIISQAQEAGWDTDSQLVDNVLPYNSFPDGTPTFPRQDMMEHVIEYHERFGMENTDHVKRSIEILKKIGYTDRDIVAMYSVLQNQPFHSITQIVSGKKAMGASL